MSEPVDLDLAAERGAFPLAEPLLAALHGARALFDAAWPTLELLDRHVDESQGGVAWSGAGFTPVPDEELAFHHLLVKQLAPLLSELVKKCKQIEELNERRAWTVLTNRQSGGFVAFGKTFTAEGELMPTPPKEGTPEYDELIAWVHEHYDGALYPVGIAWNSLKTICELEANAGNPRPPHVKLSPKIGIKVSR